MAHYNFKLAEQAQKHIKRMDDMYSAEIEYSIEHSFSDTFPPTEDLSKEKPIKMPNIYVKDMTTEKAVHNYADDADECVTAILNFASYKHPGGGFIKGSKAQEEMLCHASTLYNVISNEKFADEYKEHQNNTNLNLYKHWLIYSPRIVFPYEKVDEIDAFVNVVTCAAPNMKAFYANGGLMSKNMYREILERRIFHILKVMSEQGNKQVILGAFGCGVFGNDPKTVAECFQNILKSYDFGFDAVIFAIPAGPNLDAFQEVFSFSEKMEL